MESVFPTNISRLSAIIESKIGEPLDIHDYLHRYFLDSFVNIAFSVIKSNLDRFTVSKLK